MPLAIKCWSSLHFNFNFFLFFTYHICLCHCLVENKPVKGSPGFVPRFSNVSITRSLVFHVKQSTMGYRKSAPADSGVHLVHIIAHFSGHVFFFPMQVCIFFSFFLLFISLTSSNVNAQRSTVGSVSALRDMWIHVVYVTHAALLLSLVFQDLLRKQHYLNQWDEPNSVSPYCVNVLSAHWSQSGSWE